MRRTTTRPVAAGSRVRFGPAAPATPRAPAVRTIRTAPTVRVGPAAPATPAAPRAPTVWRARTGRAVLTVLAALAVLAVATAGCGGSSGGPAAPDAAASSTTKTFAPVDAPLTPGAAVDVSAIDNLFRPEVVKVRAGTTLTFSNDGRNDHNVLPVQVPEGAKPFRVEATRFKPGDVYEVTLDRPGTYRYYCSIHGTKRRGMIGAVIVVP